MLPSIGFTRKRAASLEVGAIEPVVKHSLGSGARKSLTPGLMGFARGERPASTAIRLISRKVVLGQGNGS